MKFKILLMFLLTYLFTVDFCGFEASAQVQGDLVYSISGYEVTITDCNTEARIINIPEQIGNFPVTAIGNEAFKDSRASFIFVPDSVKSIGESAFYGCSSLSAVNIPDGVTKIENNTFNGCTSLSNIVIPDSVTTIRARAFYNCNSLVSANIPDGVATIESSTFQNCWNLKYIDIPDSVTTIELYAFRNCGSLTSIKIPDSVTTIQDEAFYYCSNLTIITLPDVGCYIGSDAFSHTGYYNNIDNWDDGFLYINNHLIEANNDISGAYSIKDGILSVGEFAFCACYDLIEITIPESVSIIGSYAFSSCTNLTKINWYAKSVSDFKEIDNIFKETGTSSKGVEVVFGDKVEYIPAYIFKTSNSEDCPLITSVYIGNKVSSIGEEAFSGCSGITKILWNAENALDFEYTDKIFKTVGTEKHGVEVIIGEDVKKIPDFLFYYCTNLKKLTMYEGVTAIGYSAFSHCTALTDVTIPDSVAEIGGYAFSSCDGLISLKIGKGVTVIEKYAFYFCENLKQINWNAIKVQDFSGSYYIFSETNNSSTGINVTFGEEVEHIPAYLFYNCRNLQRVAITKAVSSIGVSAFSGCTNLQRVDITNLKSWCEITFKNLTSNPLYYANNLYLNDEPVTDLVIPDTATIIRNYAFAHYKKLNSVTIPKGVTTIGDYAFSNCANITAIYWNAKNVSSYSDIGVFESAGSVGSGISVIFGEDVEKIPNYAFAKTPRISSVFIGNNVTSIGAYAFDSCTNLTNITIPANLKSLGNYAFSMCKSLVEINWNATNTYNLSFNSGVFYGAGIDGEGINVVFTDMVTHIPSYLFSVVDEAYTPKIASITIGNNVQTIGVSAFENSRNLKHINWNAKNIADFSRYFDNYGENYIFYNAGADVGGVDVVFGDGVTHIPAYAFYCSYLNNLSISNSVSSIGNGAFAVYSQIKRVNITDINSWCKITFGDISEGILANTNPLYCAEGLYLNGELVTDLIIPDGVETISDFAFLGYKALDSVTIPESVTSIGAYTFAFCSNLTNITIGAGVKQIGFYAFKDCSALKQVYYNGTNEQWQNILIKTGNDELENAQIICLKDYDVATITSVADGTITVTPVNVQDGNNIICVCYKDNIMVYKDIYQYKAEKQLYFTPDAGYDTVKIMVWDNNISLKPLSINEKINIAEN